VGREPPPLPKDTETQKVPPELRDFVDCRGNALTLEPGPLTWLDLPVGTAAVAFEHGPRPGTVQITITLTVAGLSYPIELTGEVKDGQLVVDTSKVPTIPVIGSPKQPIDDWVKQFNEWLAGRSKQFGEAKLRKGKLTLTKVAKVAMGAPPGRQGWSTRQKAGAAVVGTLLVIGVGIGVGQLVSNGSAPVASSPTPSAPSPEPSEPAEPGESEEPSKSPGPAPFDESQLLAALMGPPEGFEPQAIPEDLGQGPGLCGGPGEAELVSPAAQAAVIYINQGDRRFLGQILWSYGSPEEAQSAFDQIAAQGASCSTWEGETADGQALSHTIEAYDLTAASGWEDVAAFNERTSLTSNPNSANYTILSYTLRDTVVMALNTTSASASDAIALTDTYYPYAAEVAAQGLFTQ
jgi:hypothetical protein